MEGSGGIGAGAAVHLGGVSILPGVAASGKLLINWAFHVNDRPWWDIGRMKTKTSVTLSKEVLVAIDRLAGARFSRSSVIELALRKYLEERKQNQIHARDLEILNRDADLLNAENEDWLQYQADPWKDESK